MEIRPSYTRYLVSSTEDPVIGFSMSVRIAHQDYQGVAKTVWGAPINENRVESHGTMGSTNFAGALQLRNIGALVAEILKNRNQYRNSVKDYQEE